jgi:hypothetical protein
MAVMDTRTAEVVYTLTILVEGRPSMEGKALAVFRETKPSEVILWL